jgi:hypothetical protein
MRTVAMIGKYMVFMMTSIGRLDSHADVHARQWIAHWLLFTQELLKVRIWTPPRLASNLLMADVARLHTYIRPLQLAYVDAGP